MISLWIGLLLCASFADAHSVHDSNSASAFHELSAGSGPSTVPTSVPTSIPTALPTSVPTSVPSSTVREDGYVTIYSYSAVGGGGCDSNADVVVTKVGDCIPAEDSIDLVAYYSFENVFKSPSGFRVDQAYYSDNTCTSETGREHQQVANDFCEDDVTVKYSEQIPELPQFAYTSVMYSDEDECMAGSTKWVTASLTPIGGCYSWGENQYAIIESCSDVDGIVQKFYNDSLCTIAASPAETTLRATKCAQFESSSYFVSAFCKAPDTVDSGFAGFRGFPIDAMKTCSGDKFMGEEFQLNACYPEGTSAPDSAEPTFDYVSFTNFYRDPLAGRFGITRSIFSDDTCTSVTSSNKFSQLADTCTEEGKIYSYTESPDPVPANAVFRAVYASVDDCMSGGPFTHRYYSPVGECFYDYDGVYRRTADCDETSAKFTYHLTPDCSDDPVKWEEAPSMTCAEFSSSFLTAGCTRSSTPGINEGFILLAEYPSGSDTCTGNPDVYINTLGVCEAMVDDSGEEDSFLYVKLENYRQLPDGSSSIDQVTYTDAGCTNELRREISERVEDACEENSKGNYSFILPRLPPVAFATVTYGSIDECNARSTSFLSSSFTPLNECYQLDDELYYKFTSCDETISEGIVQQYYVDPDCTIPATSPSADSFDPLNCYPFATGFITSFCKVPTEVVGGYFSHSRYPTDSESCSDDRFALEQFKQGVCAADDVTDSDQVVYAKFHDGYRDTFARSVGVTKSGYSDNECLDLIDEVMFEAPENQCFLSMKYEHIADGEVEPVPDKSAYEAVYTSLSDCQAKSNFASRKAFPLDECISAGNEGDVEYFQLMSCNGDAATVYMYTTMDCSGTPFDTQTLNAASCAAYGTNFRSAVCVVATLAPVSSPTKAPSLSPTLSPTVVPSAAPTFTPTLTPTLAPTQAPNVAPTFTPTDAPSEVPTITPTFEPTVVPTIAGTGPTRAPSKTPTRRPTAVPTFAPTKASPVLSFQSFVTIAGTVNGDISDDDKFAIRKATARSMRLDVSFVRFLGLRVQTTAARFSAESVTLIANLGITIKLSESNFTDPQALYTSLTTALTAAIAGGNFTVSLQQEASTLGSTTFDSASTPTVSYTELVVTDPSDESNSNNDDDLNDGEIAGIVIGSVIGGLLLIGFAVWFTFFRNLSKVGIGGEQTTSASTTPTPLTGTKIIAVMPGEVNV